MSSFGRQHAPPRQQQRPSAMAFQPASAPAGTFQPGTKIQVGSHRVIIQKYLSEGGFAHVYLVKMPKPVDGTDLAVLKRVAVPDKEALRGMRTEVETMKRLKGHRPIVTYIDSHASELQGGGYEVFLLMEYCDGGGLIDFMNTRLQHRLTEPEILHIFADVAEGVACMHYLKPPLLHRDIKVENVLIVSRGSSRRFKLCDFGSAATPRPAPTTISECRHADEDVQKHTTLQYRSPEMVDVYKKQPINEKSDVWALGVFLYKLCYYTTPFEDQGQLAILNASFKYPPHPVFSEKLKKLIAWMLQERMESRPNIYQVLKEACAMQSRQLPISNIYSGQHRKERSTDHSKESTTAPSGKQSPAVGAVYVSTPEEKQKIPEIAPMRRGRPTPSTAPQTSPPKKVVDGDPFAALDSKGGRKAAAADQISGRFPTLDQFSLLHDKGATKFDFDSSLSPTKSTTSQPKQPVAEHLASEIATASRQSAAKPTASTRPHSVIAAVSSRHIVSPPVDVSPAKPPSAPPQSELSRTSSVVSGNRVQNPIAAQLNSRYVSTGTMTSELSSGRNTPQESIQRTADRHLDANHDVLPMHIRPPHLRKPSLSSRPSLEEIRQQPSVPSSQPQTSAIRPRPVSANFEGSTLDFLREKEQQGKLNTEVPSQAQRQPDDPVQSRAPANLLLDIEGSDSSDAEAEPQVGRAISAAPAPKKLAGKFGDAFSRFEANAATQETGSGARPESPRQQPDDRLSPEKAAHRDTSAALSSNTLIDLDEDKMTPEMRREAERLKLEEEEQRVAAAQAEYRQRLGAGSSKPVPGPKRVGTGSHGTSSIIQSRMQSLMNEERKPPAAPRTAQGYGKYTDEPSAEPQKNASPPPIRRKPVAVKTSGAVSANGGSSGIVRSGTSASAPAATVSSITAKSNTGAKPPPAPKKPTHLNSLATGGAAKGSVPARQGRSSQLEQLIAADLPGKPVLDMTMAEKEDYVEDFTKRFPSLSAIETESSGGSGSRR